MVFCLNFFCLAPSIGASSKIIATSFEVPVAVVECADVTTVETKEGDRAYTHERLHRELKLTCDSK